VTTLLPLLAVVLPCASVAVLARSVYLLARLAASRRQGLVGTAYAHLAAALALTSGSAADGRSWPLAAVIGALAAGCAGIWWSESMCGGGAR
jgi:hypothetical protein